jgi:ribosomal protein L29
MEEDYRKQLFEMRQQEVCRKGLSTQKPHLYKEVRKNIARIKTVLNERKV